MLTLGCDPGAGWRLRESVDDRGVWHTASDSIYGKVRAYAFIRSLSITADLFVPEQAALQIDSTTVVVRDAAGRSIGSAVVRGGCSDTIPIPVRYRRQCYWMNLELA